MKEALAFDVGAFFVSVISYSLSVNRIGSKFLYADCLFAGVKQTSG